MYTLYYYHPLLLKRDRQKIEEVKKDILLKVHEKNSTNLLEIDNEIEAP